LKPASTALANLINSGNFCSFDCYQFQTTSGLNIYLTAADFDIIDPATSITYLRGSPGSGAPRVDSKTSQSRGHWKRGLDSDTWTVAIDAQVTDPFTGAYTYPDVAGTIPWLTACRAGFFENATATVLRAYYASPPAPWGSPAARTAVGTLIIFSGIVEKVDANQVTSVFSLADYKSLMTIEMPRNVYQSSCRHQLFDSGCTLSASSFAKSGTVLNGTTKSIIIANPGAPSGSGTYTLGRIVFTSGQNNGLQQTVGAWDGGWTFWLLYQFPFTPQVGDTFTVYPGCNKTLATCTAFNNAVNFGGEPFIPDPSVTLG